MEEKNYPNLENVLDQMEEGDTATIEWDGKIITIQILTIEIKKGVN